MRRFTRSDFAEPDRQPRYPQPSAEIMAGRRALSATDFDMPASLRTSWWAAYRGRDPVDSSLKPGLAARQVSVRVGDTPLVNELSVEFAPGEVVAILGCNGSGKTLTLHTLAGLRPPHAGSVHLDGVPFSQLTRRAVALRLGLLAQDIEDAFVTTALERC